MKKFLLITGYAGFMYIMFYLSLYFFFNQTILQETAAEFITTFPIIPHSFFRSLSTGLNGYIGNDRLIFVYMLLKSTASAFSTGVLVFFIARKTRGVFRTQIIRKLQNIS